MDYRSINITSQKTVKQANNNHFCSKLVSLYTSLSAFWQKFTIFCIFVDFTHYNIDAVSNQILEPQITIKQVDFVYEVSFFSLVVKPIYSFSVFGHGMIFQKTVFGTQVWFFWATRTHIACTFSFVLNCETTHSAFSLFFNSSDKMFGVFQSCQHRCIGWTSSSFSFENRLFAGFGCFISDGLDQRFFELQ